MSTGNLLIVEDDIGIANALVDCLEYEGFNTSVLQSGETAVEVIKDTSPDFVILDLMLPEKDGLTICKEVRDFSDVPIMMITARVDEIDRLDGLEFGADDYVCKPFFPREVVARVRAISRRLSASKNKAVSTISYRSVSLHPESFLCEVEGQRVPLTGVEFRLLQELMSQPGIVFSREQLTEAVYTSKQKVNPRSIDNHIKNLRKKIMVLTTEQELIHSIYGVGYKID